MTAEEKIFINTFFDLENRLKTCTQYDLIRTAGLVRQLLVDSNPLLDQVNKNYRLKIKFKVTERFDLPPARIAKDGLVMNKWIAITFILPDEKSKNVEYLSKDEFLRYDLMHLHEHKFNVIEVIRICANKFGGIHSSALTDPKDLLLNTASESFLLNNSPMIYQAMHDIAMVCKNGMIPLKEAILDSIDDVDSKK